MKAVQFHEFGNADVLKYETVDDPVRKSWQVLVKIQYCSVNHLDIWVRNGITAKKITLPHILGSDISGTIEEVDKDTEKLFPGQRVMIAPGLSCGHCRYCLSGQDNRCRKYGILGEHLSGGYAEYIVIPAQNIIPIPDKVSFEAAAASPLVFLTAYQMLVDKAKLKSHEDVLILGAGSGVGSSAIQIAKKIGSRVIATAGSDEKLAKAKELGANKVINHTLNDIGKEVSRLTDNKGVDVVFEHVGAATWESSLKSLAWGGRLVTCGATTGPKVNIDLRHLFFKQQQILGSTMGSRSHLFTLVELLESGEFKPVIDQIVHLKRAGDAHRHMEDREQFGKILLKIEN